MVIVMTVLKILEAISATLNFSNHICGIFLTNQIFKLYISCTNSILSLAFDNEDSAIQDKYHPHSFFISVMGNDEDPD